MIPNPTTHNRELNRRRALRIAELAAEYRAKTVKQPAPKKPAKKRKLLVVKRRPWGQLLVSDAWPGKTFRPVDVMAMTGSSRSGLYKLVGCGKRIKGELFRWVGRAA